VLDDKEAAKASFRWMPFKALTVQQRPQHFWAMLMLLYLRLQQAPTLPLLLLSAMTSHQVNIHIHRWLSPHWMPSKALTAQWHPRSCLPEPVLMPVLVLVLLLYAGPVATLGFWQAR
jgi:hypothetical protein